MKGYSKGWLVGLLGLMLLLAACSGGGTAPDASGSGEEIELRMMWWGSQDRHEATLKVIEMFEEAHPTIAINAEYLGSDGYWDKLNTMVAGGNAPDIMQYGNNYPDYVAKNVLLDLTPYMGEQIKLENFDPSIVDTGKLDGKQYGVNLGSNALGVIFNKALLQEAGMEEPDPDWTWEQFEQYCEQLAEALPGVYPMVDMTANTHSLGYYARQQGVPLYADGEIMLTPEITQEWFAMWARYREQGLIPDAETAASYPETGPDNSLVVENKAVMKVIWSNQVSAYQNAMQDEIGITLLPQGEESGLWLQPSQFMTGNANTEHPEEVAMFLDFMVTDPEATLVLGNERGVPGSSSVRETLRDNASEIDTKIYDYIDVAIANSREMDREMPNIGEWSNALLNISQKIAFEQMTIEDAAKETVEQAKMAISKFQ